MEILYTNKITNIGAGSLEEFDNFNNVDYIIDITIGKFTNLINESKKQFNFYVKSKKIYNSLNNNSIIGVEILDVEISNENEIIETNKEDLDKFKKIFINYIKEQNRLN